MGLKKILIVDDVSLNRDLLKEMFVDQFEILEASDGESAITCIEEYGKSLSLIFLDVVMPKVSGLDVLAFMKEKNLTRSIPVIVITGEATSENELEAYEYGAADIIYKPFSKRVVSRRAINLIEQYESRDNLEQQLQLRTADLIASKKKIEQNNEFLIQALSSVIGYRSSESGEHIERVKLLTGIMLKHWVLLYPEYHYSDHDIELMANASALHDIGKIAIPDSILNKPGKLTMDEFEIMKQHTVLGCEILENFKQDDNDFYHYCHDICRYHHERYDGKGYPDGLAGEQIPIWAQIVSVVDVFEALVSERIYKPPFRVEDAYRMITNCECGTFSQRILNCFEHSLSEMIATIKLHQENEGKPC